VTVAWQGGEPTLMGLDFFANHLSFDEKNKFYRDLFEFIPGVPIFVQTI